jgi:hypothetical protein
MIDYSRHPVLYAHLLCLCVCVCVCVCELQSAWIDLEGTLHAGISHEKGSYTYSLRVGGILHLQVCGSLKWEGSYTYKYVGPLSGRDLTPRSMWVL